MKDLTEGSEAARIFYFTLPMLIGNVFQQFYNLADSIIVGKALGKEALAAVGASFPILFLLVAMIIGITMGYSILISQYYGARDMERVKRSIDTAFIILFIASIAVTALGLAFSGPILRLLNTPPEIIPGAKVYLDITFGGIVFLFGFNSVGAVLRGLGDSKTPLYFLIVSTVLNVFLVLLFVLVFGWGIAGSAVATVIAQGFAFLAGMVYLNRTQDVIRFNPRKIEFDGDIFVKSLKLGLPTGAQQMLVAGGFLVLNSIVNRFGTDAFTAFTAAGRLDSFAVMPAMNLAAGMSTFAGQNLGANRPDRVRKGFRAALLMAAAVSVATTALVFLFGRGLVGLFTDDRNVVDIGVSYLMIVGAFYIVFSSMFVTTGLIRGAGDALVPMFITLFSLWLVRIPASILLSDRYGTDGIWWGIPIAWCAGLVASSAYYRTGRWKNKALAKRAPQPALCADDDESEWNCSKF